MANYTTSANIILSVNGKQARQMLRTLQQEAQQLQKKIAQAATAGDKATMKKLQRELNRTNKLIEQLQGSSATVDQTLRRLDKASPKELQKALRTLQTQLNGIQRGTPAWDAHVAKIKAVKAEITKLNASLANQKSLWTRMNLWLNNCQTAVIGLTAAIMGLLTAARRAVSAYASMEESMANTRKYTRMTIGNVEALNEAFMKMDTRLSREELNLLAQEAGRLGKNTLSSVKDYVEASQIIKVALVDLGDGATQTIAKISNIFGIEELYGVKDAMIKVGSTVNHLSQICTASKPFIVEFAQRMAGIGSSAKMSVPEIMAFASTLDANGQKVEMSASAISRLVMKLFQDPAAAAKTLGMEVSKFVDTLNGDTTKGLMMFLERLHQLGGDKAIAVLSPLFKDLGMDGVRMAQVLANLSSHLDMLKEQMIEANQAFDEGTSAINEFNIFNNTAQAVLDKAKYKVHELAVELGGNLFPVMRHIYTSASAFLRVLNILVNFVIDHAAAITGTVVALVAYKVAVNASNIALAVHYAWLVATQKGMAVLQGTSILLKAAFFALTGQITRAKNALAAFHLLSKLNPWGLLIAGASAFVAVLISMRQRLSAAMQAQRDLNGITKEASLRLAEQEGRIHDLIAAAKDENLTLAERQKKVDELNSIIPKYNAQLDATTGKYIANKNALDDYLDSLRKKYELEGAKEKLAEIGKQRAEKVLEQQELKEQRQIEQQMISDAASLHPGNNISTSGTGPGIGGSASMTIGASARIQAIDSQLRRVQNDIDALDQRRDAIYNAYGADLHREASGGNKVVTQEDNDYGNYAYHEDDSSNGSKGKTDKFADEKDWKARMEAIVRIDYATGKKDFLQYTEEMDAIAVEYYKKMLMHTDLSETERLTIEADYAEARKKQQEDFTAKSVELEQQRYDSEVAEAKQAYADGKYNKDTYDMVIEEREILHQRKLIDLYEQGTEERLKAEAKLTDLLIAQMQNRQKRTEELQKQYDKIRQESFGDTPSQKRAKYASELAALALVYQCELALAKGNKEDLLHIEQQFQNARLALQKKYGIKSSQGVVDSMKNAVQDSLDWLNGDGGKALTGTLDTLVSGMSAIFSQLSTLIQAELEIQEAAIEQRYDREVSNAEGNSYQIAKLEKEKQKELAKAKQEANRKMFAMQVIQAVAQTAQGAISAYSSAAAVPVVGWILAPIAAGMAVAAGALQIAAIKKQQQASEAQGYSEGGFTPDGDKDEPVGIVHAGEWVASQKLTRNPKTRPLLEALDRAQRNNTIGSITSADVSRSITAPMALASAPAATLPPVVNVSVPASGSDNTEMQRTLKRLADRLDEPFVTVNTVTGDHGIKKAQDEYDLLMKNKSPKSRK